MQFKASYVLTFLSGFGLQTFAQMKCELSRIQRFFPENRYEVSGYFSRDSVFDNFSIYSDRSMFWFKLPADNNVGKMQWERLSVNAFALSCFRDLNVVVGTKEKTLLVTRDNQPERDYRRPESFLQSDSSTGNTPHEWNHIPLVLKESFSPTSLLFLMFIEKCQHSHFRNCTGYCKKDQQLINLLKSSSTTSDFHGNTPTVFWEQCIFWRGQKIHCLHLLGSFADACFRRTSPIS